MAVIFNTILKKMKPSLRFQFLQRGMTGKVSSRKYEEVEIKVPWGKLTGKHWGPNNGQPIIALHGWQDNAASFDPLMNHLSEDISLLAIDLPGHGHSSWIPNGFMYTYTLWLQVIERIKRHYKMDKIALIGHSIGGIIPFMYACMFPYKIKFIVSLDLFKPASAIGFEYQIENTKSWQEFFELEKKIDNHPRYFEDEAIEKYIEKSGNSLDESSCRILISRGVTKYSNGTVSFNRDPRVELFWARRTYIHSYLMEMAKCVRFPYRILRADDSNFYESKELAYDVIKVIKQHSEDFEFHIIPGTHHFHMINPEIVAKILNPFIKKY